MLPFLTLLCPEFSSDMSFEDEWHHQILYASHEHDLLNTELLFGYIMISGSMYA